MAPSSGIFNKILIQKKGALGVPFFIFVYYPLLLL
jgi:hypothetical protein